MSTKISDKKVSMMKTEELVNAAKSGKPKVRAKARYELLKRGKADLISQADEV
jgi:hypothetical protein